MSLQTVAQLLRDKVRTLALGNDLADPQLQERAIAQAVLQYSLDAPLALYTTLSSRSGSTLPLPVDFEARRGILSAVEYPVGLVPMAVVPAAVARDAADEWQVVLSSTTLSSDTVRIHYSVFHVLSSTESTVPPHHENALACWAAAELCRQLATKMGADRDATIGAAAATGGTQSGELARRARDWFNQYRQALGLPDPDSVQGGQAAGTVTAWDRKRARGRFSSLTY